MSDERQMMARIERGERLESADEMTPVYRDHLVHLMTMQADSELAGGDCYVSWIHKGPRLEGNHVIAQIVEDWLRQTAGAYRDQVHRCGVLGSPMRRAERSFPHCS